MKQYNIAIDLMGGDRAPYSILKAVNYYCSSNHPENIRFLLFGNTKKYSKLIKKSKKIQEYVEFIHVERAVSPDDKPSKVIRTSTDTSLWQAIKAVKDKKADAVISAGNTGCLMAFSKLQLRTMPNIDRPAITTMLPTQIEGKNVVMLDLGANAECNAENLRQFAVIGSVYSKIMNKVEKPFVGLLNIGEEESKGNETLMKANDLLKQDQSNLFQYYGFVEGDDITKGTTDVVVTDGFTGNVALKTLEGTAKLIGFLFKDMFKRSFIAKFAYLLLKRSMKKLKKKIDPRNYNGAIFAGLNGIAVKAHGNSDYFAFANAIEYAVDLTVNEFNEKIKEYL